MQTLSIAGVVKNPAGARVYRTATKYMRIIYL